jgi:hypothetical protein
MFAIVNRLPFLHNFQEWRVRPDASILDDHGIDRPGITIPWMAIPGTTSKS